MDGATAQGALASAGTLGGKHAGRCFDLLVFEWEWART